MGKKLLVTLGIVVAVVVVLFIIAAAVVYTKVDKAFIASRMAQALHRQVSIEAIDISLFSLFSGIEIKKVALSNFKTPQELARLEGKPVDKGDLFAGLEALRFRLKILPLLRRQVELKELVLYSPVIHLTKNKQGGLNIDDLLKKPPDETTGQKPQENEGARPPLSADAIPVAIAVGEMGVKNGTINYHDSQYDQNFQIYKLTTLAHDIQIDPKDLAKKDEIKVKLAMGIKTVGALKTGSVRNFDVTIDATGKVIPFDVQTRLLEPEVLLHVAIPDGEITGLQLFNALAAIPLLGDYLGEHLSFLKDKQEWKGSTQTGLDLRYKAKKAAITNGKLDLQDARLLFDGTLNMDNQAIDLNLGMVMKKEINEAVKSGLAKKITAAIRSPEVGKYVDTGKLAAAAMQPLLNKDGQIDVKTKVGGTTKNPVVTVTQPQLGSLSQIAKDAAGSVAIEAGKGAVQKILREKEPKVLDAVEGLFKTK